MSCETCANWTVPAGESPYGMCKPPEGALPFWAKRYQTDMQTQTLRKEGNPCEAFIPKGSA